MDRDGKQMKWAMIVPYYCLESFWSMSQGAGTEMEPGGLPELSILLWEGRKGNWSAQCWMLRRKQWERETESAPWGPSEGPPCNHLTTDQCMELMKKLKVKKLPPEKIKRNFWSSHNARNGSCSCQLGWKTSSFLRYWVEYSEEFNISSGVWCSSSPS